MDDLFDKRMMIAMKNGSLGGKLNEDSNHIENKTFSNDPNFRRGFLYNWDMEELKKIDFKFEKVKTFTAEGYEVEYMVHFRPNFNPEYIYKGKYYKNDGRERVGFYIDVYDYSKKIYEKWIIVGKDDRVTFDRYNAFKCNWCFEWITDNKYYKCVGVLRDSLSGSESMNNDTLGGTSVTGSMYIIMPSNKDVQNIKLGTKFIISDNTNNPQTYEVININDMSPIGITKLFLKQCLFNPHTDICGKINEMIETKFCFDLPIEDLPKEYGGEYHKICNCIISKGLSEEEKPISNSWKLKCDNDVLYVNGYETIIKAISDADSNNCEWHIFIDDVEYSVDDLKEYFDIYIDENQLSIKCINKIMANYIVKISIYDNQKTYYDSIEMEVLI